MEKNKLDQFYTNPKVSDKLVKKLSKFYELDKHIFLEPSAGSGNFIDSLIKFGVKPSKIDAYDLEPKSENIKKADYLTTNIPHKKNRIIIGNPPFGKRSKLAIDFINKGFTQGDTVAMILPKQFNRYLTQKQVSQNAKMILNIPVEDDAFLVNDRKYDVKTVFQIWTIESKKKNIRLLKQEQSKHEDFETRIHNNTRETLKYFNKETFKWDIAVHRQGFYDYSNLITDPKNLIKNRQYMFIKAKNKTVIQKIKKIDFVKLSMSNTQTPGYSTTDFVKSYKKVGK